jgi:nucleotide-binding universal stress UspA family protein
MPIKNLLVPTDFSGFAEHALDTAAVLARKTGAKIHLFHRAHIHPEWGDLTEVGRTLYPQSQQIVDDVERRFEEINADPRYAGLEMEGVYASGNLIERVEEYVEECGIDLVVVGSHGASGFKELLIGSNTQKIVRFSHCPVLTVREKSPLEFRNIVFISNFEADALPAFRKVLDLGSLFDAHYHLLHIEDPGLFAAAQQRLEDATEPFIAECPPHRVTRHLFPHEDVEEAIMSYIKGLEADLVSAVHYGNEPLRRLFRFSLTEALINHLDVPVLSINASRHR